MKMFTKLLKRSAILLLMLALALGTMAVPATAAENTQAKTLVVYFSGTGNTAAVARQIAEDANADIFEITPADPYTDDDLNFNNRDSRVVREYLDENLRNIPLTTTDVPNWNSYTTVLIGYPIWWGDAAWPIDNFVRNNDFSGKTVIPFCTSLSSGIGNSGRNLAAMAASGSWQEGHRFSENAGAAEIRSWVDSLNLSSASDNQPSASAFSDVPDNGDLRAAVDFGVANGFIRGTSATTFSPSANVTRGQFVAFLYRLSGSPSVAAAAAFTDIGNNAGGSDFANAISWAAVNGIANGFGDETFRPRNFVTREQAVAFLHRYVKSLSATKTSTFEDVRSSAWYAGDISWGVANGIINGYSSRIFGVGDFTTRAQAVQFIYRAEAR